jgi:hypothetical protein
VPPLAAAPPTSGAFDGKGIVLQGRVLVHRHYLVQDTGAERLMMELRLTRKGTQQEVPAKP